jgi:hypothetical protein
MLHQVMADYGAQDGQATMGQIKKMAGRQRRTSLSGLMVPHPRP